MNELVFINNDRVVTDSLTVAEIFGKEHRRVMQDIRDLDCSENFRVHNFVQSSYNNKQGREYLKFIITQDGFTLLAMGYTGHTAMRFKEMYISEFNRMRNELNNRIQEARKPSYMIDDPIKRAERWITERKEYEAIKEQQKLDAPYTSFGKVVSNSRASIPVGSFAKMLYDEHGIKLGRNKLFAWLRDNGYLIKSGREYNNPKQKYVEQGWFDPKITVINRTAGDDERITTLITGKGQIKLTEILLNEFGQSA